MTKNPLYPYYDLEADPTPRVERYGLFKAATGPLDLPDRAIVGGVRWQDATTVLPYGLAVACGATSIGFTDGCGDFITGTPFVVQAALNTATVGTTGADIERLLTDRLTAGEQAVVENIFSLGTFNAGNSLANNDAAPATLTAAASVKRAIGQLDEFLASVTGTRGILHVPAVVSSYLNSDCGITKEGGRWTTPLGNVVSIGNYSGYTSAGNAPAAGHTTLYACMNTVVFRSPTIDLSPAAGNLRVGSNQFSAFARRVYLVTHNNVFAEIDTTIA